MTMTEKEELLMLRELVKQQQKKLNEKDTVIQNQDAIILEKEELLRRQEIMLENMTQALLYARKKLFGASTEVTSKMTGQMTLFETNQELAEEFAKVKQTHTVKSHTRVARQPGIREEMLAGLPTEIEEYIINSQETCTVCGSELKVIGKSLIRTEVEYVPAKLIVKQIVQQVAKCTKCGTKDSEHTKDHFQAAAIPTAILPHSIATPSLVAQVMYQKFAMGVPFNRQENDYYRMGLILSRRNMANWTIRCCEEWLNPIYDRIHAELMTCDILHMDETRIQCNKEEGKKAGSDSWMWVIQSGANESIKATFFHYSRTRSGDVPKNLLADFEGYLTTDAYAAYEKVEGIKRNLCWAHLRRYFVESIPLDSQGKEIPGSKGAEGREYVNLLFKLEEKMADLDYKEKKETRQTASRATLDAFWTWVEETSAKPTTNEKLTKALCYAQNQRKYLETFLEDGRLEISNNLCESHIRPFATARKAWLFADTPSGAKANAVMYTLVETARANEVNVYEYLNYLLEQMPQTDFYKHPELVDAYLPWSSELPDKCRLVQKSKKIHK